MRQRVTVTVDDAHTAALDGVGAALRTAGLEIDGVLGAIGVITGSVEVNRLAEIRAVNGVVAVEPQTRVALAPPDADVQ